MGFVGGAFVHALRMVSDTKKGLEFKINLSLKRKDGGSGGGQKSGGGC